MIKLNPYLNFMGKTEDAFNFYKSVFGGEFIVLQRYKDTPNSPEKAKMSDSELNKLIHVSLRIGNNTLMGTDMLESVGHSLIIGNNISLSLHPESKEEADRLFNSLSEGGKVEMPMQDMFWGDYWGCFDDKFGIRWMINYTK